MPRNADEKMSSEDINLVYKRFFKGYNAFREKPELKELLEELAIYEKQLKVFNVKDEDVRVLSINFCTLIGNLIKAFFISFIYLSFVIIPVLNNRVLLGFAF